MTSPSLISKTPLPSGVHSKLVGGREFGVMLLSVQWWGVPEPTPTLAGLGSVYESHPALGTQDSAGDPRQAQKHGK